MTQTRVETIPTLLEPPPLKVQYHTLTLPNHTQLPDKDDSFVKNFQEHPQSILLTDSILPTLRTIHPDQHFAIGQDCGIYWRLTDQTEPLYKGAEAPDWFYVPNVPPMLDGTYRRSYVMWQEHVPPLIALEFVSGNGSEERDKTPYHGKFWIYEQAIGIPYYGIYEVKKASVEMYQHISGHYQRLKPNAQGRYDIPELGLSLGIWHGEYMTATLPWLRWWDSQGKLLPTSEEQLNIERRAKSVALLQVEQERQTKELAQQENTILRAKLREMGIEWP